MNVKDPSLYTNYSLKHKQTFYNPCKPLQLKQKNFLGTPLTPLNKAQLLTHPLHP